MTTKIVFAVVGGLLAIAAIVFVVQNSSNPSDGRISPSTAALGSPTTTKPQVVTVTTAIRQVPRSTTTTSTTQPPRQKAYDSIEVWVSAVQVAIDSSLGRLTWDDSDLINWGLETVIDTAWDVVSTGGSSTDQFFMGYTACTAMAGFIVSTLEDLNPSKSMDDLAAVLVGFLDGGEVLYPEGTPERLWISDCSSVN